MKIQSNKQNIMKRNNINYKKDYFGKFITVLNKAEEILKF